MKAVLNTKLSLRGPAHHHQNVNTNIRSGRWQTRFSRIGAALLTFAIVRSRQLDFGGRVGVHAILQAREFYAKFRFREAAEPGPNEYWEAYLELLPEAANRFPQEAEASRT